MRTGTPARRRVWRDALHIVTLTSLAVVQPLFDLLGRNASFFVAHRARTADIIVLTLVVVVLPVAMFVGARLAVSAFSVRAGGIAHLVCVGVLGAIAVVSPLVRATGLGWIAALPIALVVGALIVVAYVRTSALSRFMTVLSPAVLVFVALFLFASPVRDLVVGRAAGEPLPATGMRSDVPVVFVVFDELSLPNMLRPDGEINAKRFGGFARLARRSTWYREATTVGLRTDQAVPALLTGRRTARREIPSSYAYPNNIFRLLSRTHRLDVREFVTQLCPPDLCRDRSERRVEGLGPLLRDSAIVYLHMITPPDLAARLLPPLGDRWAGFTRDAATQATGEGGGDPVRSWLRAAIDERETEHEGRVFESFLDDLRRSEVEPVFSYMHLQLPHPPWRYLPTGQTYPAGDTTPGYRNFRWGPNQYLATQVLQRAMLQSVFADRLMDRLLDRLEQRDLMDEVLLVVASDHGATWTANGTRREIDARHRASMLSVPLFVKYPGQRTGRVESRNAETIDIVPTIADVLDIDIPWDVDGRSLRGRERRGKEIFDLRTLRSIDVSFADVRRRAAEIEELFGDGAADDDLYGFGPSRELIGRRVDGFERETAAAPLTIDVGSFAPFERVDVDQAVLPAFLRGDVEGDARPGMPYVVALNGIVAGAGETFTEDGRLQIAAMLSHARFRDGRNHLAIYELVEGARLRAVGMTG